MDIKQAKEAIRRTVLAYTERSSEGQLCIPMVHQRPLLLMGPPGVGKTAVLYQLAQEMGIGLVAYTMTHHTRQSALGLPQIRQKNYGEKTYQVTVYTMSEILAAVYDYMEQTGHEIGILFLDEINCVSETLMPAMLQLLQTKQFGTHRLPEGWIIVAAGNPPQFNQSARMFDTVTMDRLRLMEITESYEVWRDYALKRGIHPAIMAYLELNQEHFYLVEPHARGRSFVTGRGWENLSELMISYERLGLPIEDELFGEFLQHDQVSASFAAFFRIDCLCREKVNVKAVLAGEYSGAVPELCQLPFEGKLSVVEFLLHTLQLEITQWSLDRTFAQSLRSFVGALEGQANQFATAKENLTRREHALRVRKECGVLSSREETVERRLIQQISGWMEQSKDCEALKNAVGPSVHRVEQEAQGLVVKMENAMEFLGKTFGLGQELVVFLTQLEKLSDIGSLLKQTSHEKLLHQILGD